MELELGLKITKTRDDIDSISEYQFMKDTGPVFKSRETNTMFILTAHLKGYKRNNIDININKDGNKISIRGKKPIQEMVMMGWVMQRKVVDIKGFNKVFKIPYGVNLDKIKANYNEEEGMLNIVMPKLVKGACGLKIEEIKEQEYDKGRIEQGKSDFDHVSRSVGETSQKESKEYEFQQMEGSENIIEKMVDDTNKELNEERILKQVGEYKLRIEDGNGESVSEKGGKKEFEDQSVGVSMSKEIEDTSQDKGFEDPKLNSGSVDKRLDDTIQKENIKPIEEGFGAKITTNEEFPKNLPKNNYEESEGLNNQKMQETKNGKEEMVSKEVEYFVEKGEGEGLKKMHVEAKKGNNTKETMKKDIEESDNEIKESGQQQVAEMKESKNFNVAKEEEQKEVKKEALVENESLIVEGDESKEITKEIVQDEEDKIENGIVKLKGEGSTKMHVEPNEPFEGENVNNGMFDGSETKMFREIGQTKDVNEKGANIEHSLKKVKRDKYEKIQNEENEGFKNNKRKGEDEWFLQEKMSKGRSKANKVAKEDLPMKFFDSPIDTREGQKNTRIEKVKGIKESENKSSMKPFEANVDVHKDFAKPKMESKNGDQESVKENPNKEGVGAEIKQEIQNYLPKSTKEQNEGLHVQKRRELKDVKENVVKRKGKEIEYFVEKGEGDRLKNMHVKPMRGNSIIETMQDENEKSEHGIEESGQQHANENIVKEMHEVSKSENEELPRQVAEIDGSKEFNVAKEEEKDEVLNEALVKSESLVEMVQGEESNQMIKAKVQDDEEKRPAKIHFEQNDPFEGDKTKEKIEKEVRNKKLESINELSEKENAKIELFGGRKRNKFQEMKQTGDVKEKNAKIGKFAKTVNEKIQNTTKENDECCLKEVMSEGRCQETKSGNGDFSIKMLDSQIDSREEPKDKEMEKTEGIKEESAKVKSEKYEKIQVEEIDGLRKDITKRKQIESVEAKIVTKIKDQQSLQNEKNKERNEASTIDSLAKSREGPKDKEIDEQNFAKSTTKEELQGFEIETISHILFEELVQNNSKEKEIETPEREFHSVASIGFKEFDYGNAKDKKHNMKLFPPKFQTKEDEEIEQNDTLKQEKGLKKGETSEFLKGETMREKTDEPKNKYKTQNANDENFKIHSEITKDGIEKEKCIHETMKTTQEKQAEPLESSLKNDIEEMKTERPFELENTIVQWKFPDTKDQHDYGAGEMKLPKIASCHEAKPPKLQRPRNNQQSTEKIKVIGEHEVTKDSPKLNIVETAKIDSLQPQILDGEENILQKKKEPKDAKIEEKHASTLQRETGKTTQTTEENELKKKEITIPFEKAGGSKRVEEKAYVIPNRKLQREIEEVTSKMVESSTTVEKALTKKCERKDPQELTRPNNDYKISKVEELQKENEVESCIHVQEATTYEEEGTYANESESLEVSLNNDSVQHEQHESGTEEIKEPKNAAYQDAKTSKLRPRFKQQTTTEMNRKSKENIGSLPPHLLDEQEEVLHVQVNNDKKGFYTPNIVEEERSVKKREGPMVAKNEETNNSSTLKRVSEKSKNKEENQPKMKEITTQFEKASETKRVEEKVHETPKRKHQRELEEVTSKIVVEPKNPIQEVERKEPLELTSPPNMVNEILKVEDKHEEKEGKMHIQVLEAIGKGEVDRGHQYVQEKNNKKEFEKQKTLEEEKVVKKIEEAKDTKSEETEDDCTFKIQDGKTTQAPKFDKASSGSKMVGEKVHETSERKDQRELEEVTSKMRVEQPTRIEKTPTNMDNEIPKVKEFRKEELERYIQELEANISKEKDRIEQKEVTGSQQKSTVPKNSPRKKHFHSDDTPTLEILSTSCTQQFEVEGEEKANKKESKINVHGSKKCKGGQEIEECINNDEEAKQEIEEIKDEEKDYEQVFEEQKECEDETRGGEKNNAKISKEFFVPLVIAGSAILVTLIAIFVRNKRARKR